MPLKHIPNIGSIHAQDGLLTAVTMDDTRYLMDDPRAIMGGPVTYAPMPRTRIMIKERSKIR